MDIESLVPELHIAIRNHWAKLEERGIYMGMAEKLLFLESVKPIISRLKMVKYVPLKTRLASRMYHAQEIYALNYEPSLVNADKNAWA